MNLLKHSRAKSDSWMRSPRTCFVPTKKFMVNQGYAGKTIDTRLNIVFFLLKKNGIAARIPRDEMPTIKEEVAVPYTDEELKRLFAEMDEEETTRYKFFLGTGCRDKGVTFAAWSDIDFERPTICGARKTLTSHRSLTSHGLSHCLIPWLLY